MIGQTNDCDCANILSEALKAAVQACSVCCPGNALLQCLSRCWNLRFNKDCSWVTFLAYFSVWQAEVIIPRKRRRLMATPRIGAASRLRVDDWKMPALGRSSDVWVGLSLWCNPALMGVVHTALAYLTASWRSCRSLRCQWLIRVPCHLAPSAKCLQTSLFCWGRGRLLRPWTSTAVALPIHPSSPCTGGVVYHLIAGWVPNLGGRAGLSLSDNSCPMDPRSEVAP